MKFPHPEFDPEKFDPPFPVPSIVAEHMAKIAKAERDAIIALLDIAEADETKPGIKISGEYHFEDERNTYVYEQTVEFSDDVPRGEVHIAPATGFGCGPFKP